MPIVSIYIYVLNPKVWNLSHQLNTKGSFHSKRLVIFWHLFFSILSGYHVIGETKFVSRSWWFAEKKKKKKAIPVLIWKLPIRWHSLSVGFGTACSLLTEPEWKKLLEEGGFPLAQNHQNSSFAIYHWGAYPYYNLWVVTKWEYQRVGFNFTGEITVN